MKSKGKRPSISRIRPPKKGKGPKPPAKDSMEAEVPRKLSDSEISERSRRLARKQVELTAHRKRKAKLTKEVNTDIKAAELEVEKLAEEIVRGEEMLPQGDLFVDGSTRETDVPSQDEASRALAQVEQATSPAAQFVATLGERNGMDEHTLRRRLWDWCADQGIRGKDAREALWLGVKELVAKPADASPEQGPQATA